LKELTAFFEAFPLAVQETKSKPSETSTTVLETLDGPELIPALAVQTSFELESPKFATGNAGIFTAAPQLSYEVDSDGEDVNLDRVLDGISPQVAEILKEFQQRFVGLKTKWTQAFLEVDSSHSYLLKDLQ